MLRASSIQQDAMAGLYECHCGYTSERAQAFRRHQRSCEVEPAQRERTSSKALKSASPQEKASPSLYESPEERRSESEDRDRPGRLSFMGGLATLWSFGQVSPAKGRASDSAEDAEDSPCSSAEGAVDPGEAGDLLCESVTDGYLEITESLQNSGDGSHKGQPSWLTTSMRRVLGDKSLEADDATSPERDSEDDLWEANAAGDKVTADDLERLLLWTEPAKTARAFGAGAYALICVRHLANGVEILQPSTALAFATICAMIYLSLASIFRRRAAERAWSRRERERALEQRIEGLATAVSERVVALMSAVASLIARRLSAGSSKASRVSLAACLWLAICVGELGWAAQATLALWFWLGLFTLPLAYSACRAALEALIDEGIAFALSAVHGGQRGTLLSAGAVGVAAFAMVEAKFFVRLSAAAALSSSVLLWQAHRLRAKAYHGATQG